MSTTILDALDAAARTSRGMRFIAPPWPTGTTAPEPERLTYAELRDAAARVGAALVRRLEAGRPILLILPNGPAVVTTFFGALHAGLVPSILNPPRPFADPSTWAEGVARVARQADDAPVVTSPMLRGLLAKSPAARDLVVIDPAELDAEPDDPRPHPVALLQYTSGSLAAPKGVILTHEAVLAEAEGIAERLGATSSDVGCFWVPLAHDMGLIGSLAFLLRLGAEQVLMATEHFAVDPAAWLRATAEHGATLLSGPPFGFELAARRLTKTTRGASPGPPPDLSAIRACVVGAEPIDARVLRRVSAMLAPTGFREDPWVAAYGLAEYACVATARVGLETLRVRPVGGIGEPIQEDPDGLELVCNGRPLVIGDVRVVGEDGQPVGERVAGRIQVTGRAAMSGFWRDLAASNAALSGPWIVTGDVGFLVDGELYVSGREKDVIIIHGRHFFPEEIEHVVQDVPGVRPGCVVAFGVVDPSGGPERVTLVAEAGKDVDTAALERALRERVVDRLDLVVSQVVFVAPRAIPRTTSGKPRRGEARTRFA
ncbi:MAG: AMP-binding protein [Deltaproteobacteria bacterium]|nr:AMP-binding protein [Deltaproteobacteria bacterium]